MMRIVYFVSFIVFFISCHQKKEISNNNCCKSQLKKNFENYTAKKLGREYQSMKKNMDKCCGNFGGDFQKLMQALSDKLNEKGTDSCCVISIMGAPDATEIPKQYGNFISGNEKIMIYWWRHWHDFLYFITENGKVKQTKWFYAYE